KSSVNCSRRSRSGFSTAADSLTMGDSPSARCFLGGASRLSVSCAAALGALAQLGKHPSSGQCRGEEQGVIQECAPHRLGRQAAREVGRQLDGGTPPVVAGHARGTVHVELQLWLGVLSRGAEYRSQAGAQV